MTFITSFDKTKIFYTHHKSKKETLVFLHGWPHNHTVWNEEVRYIHGKGFGTIALDLRGHGKSGMPSKLSAYKLENFARDVKIIIDNEGIDDITLVGHSFGGMVAIKFMELFGMDVRKLVLIDTTYENPIKDMSVLKYFNLTPMTKHVLKFILKHETVQKNHFDLVDFSNFRNHSDFYLFLKGFKETSFSVVLICLKEMMDYHQKKFLSKIKVPTLIIEGQEDLKTPMEDATMMNKRIKDSKLVVLKKATHDTNIQNSKMVSREIFLFVSEPKS